MSHRPDMLRIAGLTVTYRGGFRAVDDVSLTVGCDESVALVGESGCGKSTTLGAVLGLLPPQADVNGSIVLDDEPLHELDMRERATVQQRAGYVTQDPYSAYDPLRTVRHHVLEPLRARRRRIDEPAVLARIAAAGVPDPDARWRQYPHQWSGGMLQRADIIAATALDPPITLADEPTSALDADLADDMMRVLREQSEALLFVTHDLELAARHADRILVMDRGRIVEEATAGGLFEAPSHRQTIRLVEAIRRRRAGAAKDRGPMQAQVIADARDVTKRYRTQSGVETAVDGADLQVQAGEIVGIYGRSGSGKSTLLRLLGGLEEPDSGTVRRVAGAGAVLPIFQDPVASLDPRWPVWRTITEPLLARRRRTASVRPATRLGDGAGEPRLSRRRRKELARRELASVGLGHIDPATYPRALSVGQCQRVAIARAICAAPPLVIADEPTASLDVTTAGEIAVLLRALADRGTALVIVSHDVAFLRSVADRVLRMHDGRLAGENPRTHPLAVGSAPARSATGDPSDTESSLCGPPDVASTHETSRASSGPGRATPAAGGI